MQYIGSITSKRQLTIPAAVFRKLKFSEGQKVLIREEKDGMKITPMLSLVKDLAGSVKVPKRFEGLSPDEIIKKAKEEYFKRS